MKREKLVRAIYFSAYCPDYNCEHGFLKEKCQECAENVLTEYENQIYNQALEDAENRYREWSKSEYGKIVSDDVLPIRVLRSLMK